MIVLDTHAWVWWVSNPERLSAHARKRIEQGVADKSVHVSSISTWEVAMLVSRGRLELTMDVGDWVARCEALPFLKFVPVTNSIAIKSVLVPGARHTDPADRIIIATSLELGAALITRDENIRKDRSVRSFW